MEAKMFTIFRVIDTETKLHSTPAILTARELAAFRRLMQYQNIPIDPDPGEIEGTAYHFEVNANGIPLAAFATALDFRADVIAVVEEAHWLGRSLRVERVTPTSNIVLRVSNHIAFTNTFTIAEDLAAKAFHALGIDPRKTRSITINQLRTLLQNPAVFSAFDSAQIEAVYNNFAQFAFIDCGEQQPELEWQ